MVDEGLIAMSEVEVIRYVHQDSTKYMRFQWLDIDRP
jgi:hypothetical protein